MNSQQRLDQVTQEALAELAEDWNQAQRLPGDMSISEICNELNITPPTAWTWMRKKVKAGQYEELKVRDEETGKEITVFRKVDPSLDDLE